MPNDWMQSSQGLCIDGVNSSVRPDLIGSNQLAWMENGTVRDGKPRTRPGMVQRLILPPGRFQGAGYYSLGSGKIMLSIGGHIYRVFLQGSEFIEEEVPLAFQNSSLLDEAWMVETPSGFVIQDDQSDAIIYNGSTAQRSDPAAPGIPIGSAMAYGNGRLWVVVGDRRTLEAGDIFDGTLGSEWKFIENQKLVGGGSLSFPYPLTGLGFLPVNDTSTGYGSLMVFGNRSVLSIRAEVGERDLWQIIPGFQTIVLEGIGTPSHHCITRVNQDLYFRDEEGQVRSVRSAAQEAQGPGNSGLSREVSRIVDFETESQLRLCSGAYFDSRLLFTASPLLSVGLPQNVVFQKLISLDCSPLSSMRGKQPPAYDGEWNGADILRVVQGTFRGEKRAFAIVRRGTENSLWEFTNEREDSYLDGGNPSKPVRIQNATEFRRFDFGEPSKPKQLTRCDVYPSLIEGDVDISIYWRVGNWTQWLLWGTFSACAKMEDPPENAPSTPHVWKNLRSQERGRVKSLTIPVLENPIMNLAQSTGYSFQIRLVWTGDVTIDRIDVWARELTDKAFSNVFDLPDGCVQSEVTNNDLQYTIIPE